MTPKAQIIELLANTERRLSDLTCALEFCICFDGFQILNESTPSKPSFTACIDDCTHNSASSIEGAILALARDIGLEPNLSIALAKKPAKKARRK